MAKLLPGREPCTHCGDCCRVEVCPIGEIFMRTTEPPCPALAEGKDGKSWCGLVVCPEAAMYAKTAYGRHWARDISNYLAEHVFLFGTGCERTGR